MRITATLLAPLCLALFGCAEMQRNAAIAERDAIIQECKDFGAESRFDPLRGKIPLSYAEAAAQPTLSQVTNQSMASDVERPLLLQLDARLAPCREKFIRWGNKYLPPQELTLMRELQSYEVSTLAALYNGKVSYGDAWSSYYEARTKVEKAIADFEDAARSQQIAQQQAASAALLNAMQGVQMMNQRYYPQAPGVTTTNCQAFGNSLQCRTQ